MKQTCSQSVVSQIVFKNSSFLRRQEEKKKKKKKKKKTIVVGMQLATINRGFINSTGEHVNNGQSIGGYDDDRLQLHWHTILK